MKSKSNELLDKSISAMIAAIEVFSMFYLPLKIVQRLDMPKAFAGDGTEGQGAEKVDEENFRYVKELPFAE